MICRFRNNICITREEIDENAPSTPKPEDDGIKDIELEVPLDGIASDDEDITDETVADESIAEEEAAAAAADAANPAASRRLKREFTFNSTLRISSCSDKGLSYVCETKCDIQHYSKRSLMMIWLRLQLFQLEILRCNSISFSLCLDLIHS